MIKKRNNWYKLDNAAKVYPPSKTKSDPKLFRFSCELKKDIDKWKLQEALDKTLIDFPVFNSEIKTGFFWHYLEISNLKAMVKEETKSPCSKLKTNLLFEVTYYKKRINLEVSHVLTDGTGALEFMRNLVYNYLSYPQQKTLTNSSLKEKEIDSFDKYYRPHFKLEKNKKVKALTIKGSRHQENNIHIIEGILSVTAIKNESKKLNTTITIYLTSILIKSIEMTLNENEKNKPIVITVPVDLRKHFPSKTIRNFFNIINVSYKPKKNSTLEEIITIVDKQFKSFLDKKELQNTMNKNAYLEKILLVRLIPLFIKNIVIKYVYRYSRLYHTMTISNVGKIEIPDSKEEIKQFSVLTSTDGIQACLCSYKDVLTLTFTSHFIDTEIERNFFCYLASFTKVAINTNMIEEGDINE